MTTKTDITLPPLPGATLEHPTGNLKFYGLETLKGYARAAVEADRKGRMPSDEELLKWAGEEQFFLFCDEDEFLQIAREVLSRYGGGQPATNTEPTKRPYAQSATLGEYGIIPECDTRSAASAQPTRCEDCPPVGYPTDKTRCAPCDRRAAPVAQEPVGEAIAMPGTSGGFTMATFRGADVPVGTKLYAARAAKGE